MTLDEAIKHCKQKVEDLYLDAVTTQAGIDNVKKCLQCAEEHGQLADWLKELKRFREQESCRDCISRQAVLDQTYLWSKDEFLRVTNPFDYLRKRINNLPLITPARSRGKWISETFTTSIDPVPKCPFCNKQARKFSNFCPNCGADMRE